jgi:hypothetical protein
MELGGRVKVGEGIFHETQAPLTTKNQNQA